jgi:hypothetical protein
VVVNDGISFFLLLNSIPLCIWTTLCLSIHHPTNVMQKFPFLHIFFYHHFPFFSIIAILTTERWYLIVVFYLHYPDIRENVYYHIHFDYTPSCSFLVLFFGGTEFWIKGLMLARQVLYHLSLHCMLSFTKCLFRTIVHF